MLFEEKARATRQVTIRQIAPKYLTDRRLTQKSAAKLGFFV